MPAGFNKPPPLVYQAAIQDSRYGFHFADPGRQGGQDNATMAHHGEVVGPTSHGGFVAPMSRGGSAIPSSRGGSVVPMSRGRSTVPSSHGGSAAPSSHRGSTIPSSRSASVVPTSHTTSPGMVSGFRNRLLPATGVPPRSQSYPSH